MLFLDIIYMVAIITFVVGTIAGIAIYRIDKNAEQNDGTN